MFHRTRRLDSVRNRREGGATRAAAAVGEPLEGRRLLSASLLKDTNQTPWSPYPQNKVAPAPLDLGNGVAIYSHVSGENELELYRTDGTAAGTFEVKDINPGLAGSAPQSLTRIDNSP